MNERPHVIEIDSIVLDKGTAARPRQLTTLIEAELSRALGGSALGAPALANRTVGVVGEIARSVVRAIGAGADDV